MSFKVLGTNTGNAQLTPLYLTSSSPEILTASLKKDGTNYVNALQPSLGVGQTNILLYDTTIGLGRASGCIQTSDCSPPNPLIGFNEVCVGSPQSCKIDVSNILNSPVCLAQGGFSCNLNYTTEVKGDYVDALGVQQLPVSTQVLLSLTFAPDEVIFRTSSTNGEFLNPTTEIATDRNGDRILESYVFQSSSPQNFAPTDFISKSVQGNLVWRCGSNNICISTSTTLDKSTSYTSITTGVYILGGTISLSIDPTEPYTSTNCGGIKPCEEVYTVGVEQPAPFCGDGIINQPGETCDTLDLAGLQCSNFPPNTEGTLACYPQGHAQECTFDTSQCTTPPIQDPNLQVQIKFNGNVLDSSGKGSNGIIVGTPIFVVDKDGIPNSAIQLNGISDYINLGTNNWNIYSTQKFTVSVWALQRNVGTNQWIIGRGQYVRPFWLYTYNTNIRTAVRTSGGVNYLLGQVIIQNTWNHYVLTYGDGYRAMYKNGVLESSNNIAVTLSPNIAENTLIGVNSPGTSGFFSGSVDDARIYNRALTPTEINNLYTAGPE